MSFSQTKKKKKVGNNFPSTDSGEVSCLIWNDFDDFESLKC